MTSDIGHAAVHLRNAAGLLDEAHAHLAAAYGDTVLMRTHYDGAAGTSRHPLMAEAQGRAAEGQVAIRAAIRAKVVMSWALSDYLRVLGAGTEPSRTAAPGGDTTGSAATGRRVGRLTRMVTERLDDTSDAAGQVASDAQTIHQNLFGDPPVPPTVTGTGVESARR